MAGSDRFDQRENHPMRGIGAARSIAFIEHTHQAVFYPGG
jgi:hypothetical protein